MSNSFDKNKYIDQFFQRILDELREDVRIRSMQSKPRESQLREELYFEYQAYDRIEQKLKTYADRKVF
jgi:hypothetical protein